MERDSNAFGIKTPAWHAWVGTIILPMTKDAVSALQILLQEPGGRGHT